MKMKKDYITIKELEEKEQELIAEYNEYVQRGWRDFAANTVKDIQAVRYVKLLIKNGNK